MEGYRSRATAILRRRNLPVIMEVNPARLSVLWDRVGYDHVQGMAPNARAIHAHESGIGQ
jgi:hypothetical protein